MTRSQEREWLREALSGPSAARSQWAARRWRHRHADAPPPVVAEQAELLGELWCAHRQSEALEVLTAAWRSDARLVRALAVLGGAGQRAVLLDALARASEVQHREVVHALVASGDPAVLDALGDQAVAPSVWLSAVLREAPNHAVLPEHVVSSVQAASDAQWAGVLEAPLQRVPELRAHWGQARGWQGLSGRQVLEARSAVLMRRRFALAAGEATVDELLWWLPRVGRLPLGPLLREAPEHLAASLQARVRSWLRGRSWDAVEASLVPAEAAALAVLDDEAALLDLVEGGVPDALLDLLLEQAPRAAVERLADHADEPATAAVLVQCCVVHQLMPEGLERWRAVVIEAERQGALESRNYRRLARIAVADGMGRLRGQKKRGRGKRKR